VTDVFTAPPTTGWEDEPFAPVIGPDAVVLAVRDPRGTARRYCRTLAMRCTAFCEQPAARQAYVLVGGGVRYVLTAGSADGGVLDLSLQVTDAYAAYDYAVDRGAVSLAEPYELSDRYGTVVLAAIASGPDRHTLVDRTAYSGPYLPGFEPAPPGVLGGL